MLTAACFQLQEHPKFYAGWASFKISCANYQPWREASLPVFVKFAFVPPLYRRLQGYHLQTIKWFKNAEQDKPLDCNPKIIHHRRNLSAAGTLPIANMPLDTFKISKSKDDFPLESVS